MIRGIPRSVIRESLRNALLRIDPENSPRGDTSKNYGTAVKTVTFGQGTLQTVPPAQMPWIGIHVDEFASENLPSHTLRMTVIAELTLRVSGPSQTAAVDALDTLVDDVIAAVFDNYTSREAPTDSVGVTYDVHLQQVRELDTEDPKFAEAVVVFQYRYLRGTKLCRAV